MASIPQSPVLHIKCRASAALIPNNLSASEGFVAYIHGGQTSEVHVLKNRPANFSSSQEGKSTLVNVSTGNDCIHELRFVTAFGSPGLVLLYGPTIALFSEDGTTLKSFHTAREASESGRSFGGIAADAKRSLFVGQSTGSIAVFTGSLESMTSLNSPAHRAGITSVDVDASGLVLLEQRCYSYP